MNIDLGNYIIGEESQRRGHETVGIVHMTTGEKFHLKQLQINSMETLFKLFDQIYLFSRQRHPNILMIYGYTFEKKEKNQQQKQREFGTLRLVIERAELSVLEDIKSRQSTKQQYKLRQLIDLLRQSVSALKLIEELGYLKRSLNPNGIYISNNNGITEQIQYKLGYEILDIEQQHDIDPFSDSTIQLMAPEEYQHLLEMDSNEQGVIDISRASVFTLGMILLQAASLENITTGNLMNKEIRDTSYKKVLKSITEQYSGKLTEIIMRMLTLDVQQRPNIIQLYQEIEQSEGGLQQYYNNEQSYNISSNCVFSVDRILIPYEQIQIRKNVQQNNNIFIVELQNCVQQQQQQVQQQYSAKLFQNIKKHQLMRKLEELEIITRLDYPNILKVYGVSILNVNNETSNIYLIQDLKEYNLTQAIRQGKLSQLRQRVKIAVKLAESIHYLHTRAESLIHGNIKPKNILLDKDLNIYISDMRLTLFDDDIIDDIHYQQEERLTNNTSEYNNNNSIQDDSVVSQAKKGKHNDIGYTAPEYFINSELSYESDIWSLGVIYYKLFFSQYVWPISFQVEEWVNKNKLYSGNDLIIGDVPQFMIRIRDLIENMIKFKSNDRITIDAVLTEIQAYQNEVIYKSYEFIGIQEYSFIARFHSDDPTNTQITHDFKFLQNHHSQLNHTISRSFLNISDIKQHQDESYMFTKKESILKALDREDLLTILQPPENQLKDKQKSQIQQEDIQKQIIELKEEDLLTIENQTEKELYSYQTITENSKALLKMNFLQRTTRLTLVYDIYKYSEMVPSLFKITLKQSTDNLQNK